MKINVLKGYVFAQDCPSRKILTDLTSRWSVLILIALRQHTLRFSELKKLIGGVSEKMLAQTLKVLEADGFILRRDYGEVPPKVDYQLTALGRAAADRVFELTTWIENSLPEILAQKK
jgi:DNA-binding HxlR family transcriptional regulator